MFQIRQSQQISETNQKPPDKNQSITLGINFLKIARNRDFKQKVILFFKILVINLIGQIIFNGKNDFFHIPPVRAQDAYLNGIGYREQALQVPKGALFMSEDPVGVLYASFAGDTNIFIRGSSFSMTTRSNQIKLTCVEIPEIIIFPLILAEDDIFNSHPALGELVYRIPPLNKLLRMQQQQQVFQFTTLNFIISVKNIDSDMEDDMVCSIISSDNCRISYQRYYTPMIHYISPQTVYYQSKTQITFDPQLVPSKIINLTTDDKPFVNAKISGQLIDFEFQVDENTIYNNQVNNLAKGTVGTISPGINQNITMLWEVGGSMIEDTESVTCDVQGQNCYQAKGVPVIFNMSANQGYTTGGQNLTVNGFGLNNPNLTATLDGQNCLITSYSNTSFSCTVSPAAQVSSINVTQPGGYGAKRRIYNASKTSLSFSQIKNMAFQEEHLHLNFELPTNLGTYYGSRLTSFFIPPLNTRYRFYMACDDICDLSMSLDPSDPTNTTTLLTNWYSAGRARNFWSTAGNQTRITDWIPLQANKNYFIQSYFSQYSGADYLSVGVEIEQNSVLNHTNSMIEVQNIQVVPPLVKDTWQLTMVVDSSTKGNFNLVLRHPTAGFQASDTIPVRATAGQLQNALLSYYQNNWRSGITVNLTMQDSLGVVTTNKTNATLYQYFISCNKLIANQSSTSIQIGLKQTKAQITIIPPSQVQISSPPLSGKYQIQCNDSYGNTNLTNQLSYDAWEETIREYINYACPIFAHKIQVERRTDGDFNYYENGLALQLIFSGYNQQPGQFRILSGNVEQLSPDTVVYSQSKIQNKNSNIFYPTIPFELLRTVETLPQLLVKVGELPAVCHNLTCNYTYIAPPGQITQFSFDQNSLILTIQGTNLPNSTNQIQQIDYAKSQCLPTQASSSTIQCALVQNPTCGSYTPNLISIYGQIPLASGVSTQVILCSQVSQVLPSNSLNLLGGDNITIISTNLPIQLQLSNVSINFNDSKNTSCSPLASNTTSIVCLTNAFNIADASKTVVAQIYINDLLITNTQSLVLRSKKQTVQAITPASVSPVLKSQILVQLPADFPYTVVQEDFSVNATNQTNANYVRYLKVIKADDATKTITVMFGGAWSGTYSVAIRHRQEGLLDTSQIVLDVSAGINSVSPIQGSIMGGTILTIQGYNFGTQKTDNPVQLQMAEGAVGNLDCFLITTNSSTITCQLDNTTTTSGKIVNVLVFLKVSEEAKGTGNFKFTFTNQIPNVTSIQQIWDQTNYQYQIQIGGTGFNSADMEGTVYKVNGTAQPILSLNTTYTIFTLTNLTGSQLVNNDFYFPSGYPLGKADLIDPYNISLTPQLVSISPNSGSIGGTIIVANIQGVGRADANNLQLVLQNGTQICSQVTIPSYGQVICRVIPKSISAQSIISVKLNTQKYGCANSDTSKCMFQQLSTDLSMPVLMSSSIASNTIVFTGTGFFTSSYTPKAVFNGIQADSIVVSSTMNAVATWNLGVPLTSISTAPELRFESQNVLGTAIIANPNGKNLTNAFTLQSSNAASLSCSFSGGCKLQIQADGLSSMLNGNPLENSVQVCGVNCSFLQNDSTLQTAVCKLPAISTLYSNQNFNISAQNPDLKPTQIWGTMKNISAIFDGINLNSMTQVGQTSQQCVIGVSFKESQVAYLTQVRLFQNDKVEISKFINGQLKFQGSSDNVTWIDLWQGDNNYHEGWNYIPFSNSANSNNVYRFYRILGGDWGSCGQSEIKFTGVETVNDQNSIYQCPVKVYLGNISTILPDKVIFDGSITPLLTSINPRYGTVTGGDTITFTGSGFSQNIADYTISLDGRICNPVSANPTSVTCVTDKRPGLIPTVTSIFITGKGFVSTQGLVFTYVNLWSNDASWGGEFAPMNGETIHIPQGLNLVVDINETPFLNTILVEGSLIFIPDPVNNNHQRSLDAQNILVFGGKLEAGTEQYPYTSKLTITMHGNQEDPFIPIYGNKVIGVRYGTIDMHGVAKEPTWTYLDKTAPANSNQVTLSTAVNWQVGDLIAISSTSYDGREGEQRTIIAIDNITDPNKPILTLDSPLEFQHFAKIEQYGSEYIDMRAEIGCLSRNVKYRGDPETSSQNQYGAIFFFHSPGDDSLTARLDNIEMTDVGQANKVGHYAVHFHMIGAVHNSYVKQIAIHQSFNRAVTMHGTHYLRMMENVVYETMGHNFFIEDAAETKNYMYRNLVMKVMRSCSLLNTDFTPAGFWITHPDNNFIGNHVGGSDRYAYWYDLKPNSIGPNASPNICPINSVVGEFRDNSAHSCERYGLRIFHGMIPRKYPCLPIIYDESNESDPYWQNPPITANFYNLTSWKNGRNGAIAERMGDVRFHQFKVSDNILAGIEFSLTNEYGDNKAQVNDSLINGMSNNTDWMIQTATPRGIITARTESFTVQNTRFFNFNWLTAAAFGTCSHCFHPAATDSGGRTTTLKNLTFDSTVTRYISYQFPFLEILHDVDGSFTGLGPNSWATPYYPHHNVKECQYNEAYNGMICDGTAQVRRIAFVNALPADVMTGMSMKVLIYDDDLLNSNGFNKTDYLLNQTNYTSIQFRPKLDPMDCWPVPLVTGHKYKISWGNSGIDWTQMQFDMSIRWQQDDKPIYFVNNYTDTRARLNLTIFDSLAQGKMYQPFQNNSIPTSSSDYQMGQFVLYNDTSIRETHFIVSPKNISTNPWKETKVLLSMDQCIGPCNAQVNVVPQEDFIRYWANASDWPTGKVPDAGQNVEVLSGWNMIYNLGDSPIYGTIVVNGNLTFYNTTDQHLRCKILFIRAGELHIGSSDYPFTKKAIITLYGARNESTIAFDNVIEAGNKMLVNVNKVFIYGQQRKQTLMRLRAEVTINDTQILIDPGLDLVPGDRLALLPTSYNYTTRDDVFIQTYNSSSGLTTLNSSLNFYHYGAPDSTASKYSGIDIRGEVLLLSRNILIHGEDKDGWGCQIVTSDTVELYNLTMIPRYGQMILDNVEIWNCSQTDSYKAAIRFDNAATLQSQITNSAIHNGNAWGVRVVSSKNILFFNNIIFAFSPIGFAILSSANITINQNIVGYVYPRTSFSAVHLKDKEGAFSICAYNQRDKCSQISVTNNIGAASSYSGFVIGVGYKCGEEDTQQVFRNNIAHSNSETDGDGAIVGSDVNIPDHDNCVPLSNFAGYKNSESGAIIYAKTLKIQISNVISIDNIKGLTAQIFGGVDDYIDRQIQAFDNSIYGESDSPDCPNQGHGGFCLKRSKMGLQSFYGMDSNKNLHITSPSFLPANKISDEPIWNVKIQLNRTKFFGFKSKTWEGKTQSILALNPSASDYIPMHQFFDSTFTDVNEDSMAFIMQPPQEWANPDDCGLWPCSGPLNALFSFKNTTFAGSSATTLLGKDFQIIADNPGFSQHVPNCYQVKNMSHWICQQNQGMSILLFDSLDTDRRDRSMQPIFYQKQGTMIKNNLNAAMDQIWDGFYTGQKRLQRFPGVVWAPLKSLYDIIYTGTPPKNQRFKLISQDPLASMTVRIAYPDASSYQILINNQRIPMNEWDDSIRMYGKIQGTFCGENRFIGVKNILEFYLTVNCDVFIAPRDAIQTNVRMEWTMAAFFASGGTTTFIDRLAGALGIHSSDIKVVSVYEGSLVLNYAITSEKDDKEYLYQIGNQSINLYATGQIDLGAPILDVTIIQVRNTNVSSQTTQSQRIVSNGIVVAQGYDRIIITNVTTNQNTPQEFLPNIGISQNTQTIYKDIVVQQGQNQTQQNQQQSFENLPNYILQKNYESWVYIFIGALVAITIISILIIIRYCIIKKNSDLIRAQKLAERRENENEQNKNQIDENNCKTGNEEVDRTAFTNQKLKVQAETEILQYQYDPAVDFPVFGVGDKRLGGLQSLRDKMNLGDDLNSSSSVENPTQGVQITNFQNGEASDTLVVSRQQNQTDVKQIMAQDLIRKKSKYQLDEDKEIKEEEE